MKRVAATLLILGAYVAGSTAMAAYPERPITYIVPYNAGGGNDTGSRTWAPYLERCLGPDASVVVVNKPGAGGVIGFTEIANADPDGYTLGSVATPNMPLGFITRKDPPYNIDSFTYIANVYGSSSTISAMRGGKFNTFADVIEAGKKAPLTWGMSGFGSDDHLMGLRIAELTGIKLTYIPLDGAAAVRNAVLGGQIDLGGLSLAESSPFQDGLNTLAVATEQRSELLPDVPTFRELGYDLVGGSLPPIVGPKGLPEEVVTKVSGCFDQIVKNPEFQAEAAKRKLLLVPMNAEQTDAYVRSQSEILKALWEKNPWQ